MKAVLVFALGILLGYLVYAHFIRRP